MISFISQPWPWYVSGLAIAVIMTILIFFGKSFGFSANLSTICSMMGAGKKVSFFSFDWKKEQWNLWFLVGSVVGGFIAVHWLQSPEPMRLSAATVTDLQKLNIPFDGRLEPASIFNWEFLTTWRGIILFLVGGFLIGFGTRYAGGCTSGHAISGLSNLQLPSLIAVIGFFIGGLIVTHLLFPVIFK
ncbi:MAG: YeeE/YedE thiosulfate transporter family protein [Bacteroidota bacterium]|nr:YeeE/YedE thiosulfate transporter family protein [Bacteroidota bacterium]MDP4212873.1 YeeE/YedE thiosulfate transporter family protein [Bacteroidota bacterium]MDP4251038.1 YeeE/YedE thiosulfate transporter family protein [Bacteroidota bacterium]